MGGFNLNLKGITLKFEKFVPSKRVKYLKCDVDGKELIWKSGEAGHYQYRDGKEFTGTRTEVYNMNHKGEVMEKFERTSVIEEYEELPMELVNDLVTIEEYGFCFDENIAVKKPITFPLMLKEGNQDNVKRGIIYRNKDGALVLVVKSDKTKSEIITESKKGLKIKRAIKGLQSKKIVKRAILKPLKIR